MEEDHALAESIMHSLPENRCFNMTGFTRTLRELFTLFHMVRLLITNDGGPGQFAVLTPARVMIFFRPETPTLYGPMIEGAAIFYSHLPCSPCLTAYNHRNSPCDGNNQCLKSIDVDRVYQRAVKILNDGDG